VLQAFKAFKVLKEQQVPKALLVLRVLKAL
jgi:hypothetical protein